MPTTNPTPNPNVQYFDNFGKVLAGGQLYTYVAGSTTPQATYTDETGATPNTNPIILNSAGRANVWLTQGASYRFDLYDQNSVLVWSVDNIAGGSGAGLSTVTANTVYAGPTAGGPQTPTFRALVAADIPSIGGSYATAQLNNLGTTSINAALLAQTGIDLGSAAAAFRFLFLFGAGTFGSTSLRLGGTPTGARQWTLQDATDILVGRATTDTLTNKTLTAPTISAPDITGHPTIEGVTSTGATGTGNFVFDGSPAIVTPTIASFVNSNHNHQSAAGGGLLPPLKYALTLVSADQAIPPHSAVAYVVTKGSICLMGLAAPTAGTDDGLQIVVTSNTAFAHQISTINLLQTGTASVANVIFAAFAGASVTLMAYNGKWNVIAGNGVTFS